MPAFDMWMLIVPAGYIGIMIIVWLMQRGVPDRVHKIPPPVGPP